MEMQMEEASNYLSIKNGKVIFVTNENLRYAEEFEDKEFSDMIPDWQKEMINEAKDLLASPDSYIATPGKYEINEYGIMEDFIEKKIPEKVQFHFYNAIQGSGAFGRFKEAVYHEGMKESWYAFREDSLKKKAIEWCKENGLSYYEK